MSITTNIILAIIAIVIIAVILIFNKMVRLRNATRNTFSQIDILIRKRTNILQNIAIIVQSETKYEKGVLTQIATLRTNAFTLQDASTIKEEIVKTNKISKQIFAIKEAYPNLKSNNSFIKFIKEMTLCENEIMRMRHVYNNVIETYNNYIQVFPMNIFSKLFNFETKDFLEY